MESSLKVKQERREKEREGWFALLDDARGESEQYLWEKGLSALVKSLISLKNSKGWLMIHPLDLPWSPVDVPLLFIVQAQAMHWNGALWKCSP